MKLLKRLLGLSSSLAPNTGRERGAAPAPSAHKTEQGIMVFENTAEVIRAERLLEEQGVPVKVMGPPPDLRSGCDMVLVFPLLLELAVRTALANGNLYPVRIVPLHDLLLEPVSLFHARRYGDFLMVRAANMKMTTELPGGRIVNVSGGGCPDVPYLAALLVGSRLTPSGTPQVSPAGKGNAENRADIKAAEAPRLRGRTLCSYSLQKAFEETERLLKHPEEMPEPEAFEIREGRQDFVLPENRKPQAPRPWLICGSVPDAAFPLCRGRWRLNGEELLPLDGQAGGQSVPVRRGTPALIAATLASVANMPRNRAAGISIEALLVGDDGSGAGSRALYEKLADEILPSGGMPEGAACAAPGGLTFHYLFPDIDGHNRVLMALEKRETKPVAVADAGFMYAAKMSGYAANYDLFTPDVGELAFLADERAPHPFYTRGYILAEDRDIPALVERAFLHGNCPRHMLVKGARDMLFRGKELVAEVELPCVPAMEAMGGTGDFVAGMATGLLAAGYDPESAALAAARCNRLVGAAAEPTPATQVAELLPYIPDAMTVLPAE